MNNTKAVLLCRVSSKEQEETGYSLPAQEKLLKSYSETKVFEVTKVFSISESASGRKQRETFNGMMVYVDKNGVKIIVIEKVDRLTRNFKDAVMIDEWLEEDEERQVHFVKDSLILHRNSRSQEKLNWGIRIIFAKNYIDNLSEEVKKGQQEKVAQGWLPTKPPIGYKTIGEKGHKIHVIDETKAPLVKKMFELYATSEYSIKKLTEIMYQEGLRNLGGNKIVKSRTHQYLRDPFYCGKIRWNDRIYDGKHEPLIDEFTFNRVQTVLHAKSTPMYTKHDYLFKGLIYCIECTGLITWETAKGHTYGHCNHYRNCSQEVWVKQPDIEKQMTEKLKCLEIKSPRLAEWLKKALKENHKDEIAYHSASVGDLSKQQTIMKQRLDRLYDDKLDGKITEEFYQRKFQQYSADMKSANDTVNRHNNASLKYFELGINIFELSQRAAEIFQKATIDQKRMLIRLVFEKLTLDKGILSHQYTQPFEILYSAVKQTNCPKLPKNSPKEDAILEPDQKEDTSIQIDPIGTLRPVLLPRQGSNLRHPPYKCPQFSLRLGLSHPPRGRSGV